MITSGTPLPSKSATRIALAGLAVGTVTGLAKRPAPSPVSRPKRVRAGVDRHQVGRAAGGERAGGHARGRLQGREGRRAVGGSSPRTGRRRRGRARAGRRPQSPRFRRTPTWPETLLVTMMSVARRPDRHPPGSRPRRPGRPAESPGARKRALPVASLPEPVLKKTERVPSPALRTTRSSQPSPLRSAVTICAGSEPVGSDPIRTKLPSR